MGATQPDFTAFVFKSDSVVNSDPSKCSPLLEGCDLQAKIRDGLHLPRAEGATQSVSR